MEKKTIGSFIAALRKANGMTQQKMADKLNISNKAISRWERDECSPDLSLIPAIAEMFDVSCDELLKGERITGNTDTNRPSPKIEKQVKQLFNRTLSRFKSAVAIAISGNAVGFVLLLAISYGFYKPIIGFAVLSIFAIVSVLLTLLSLNRLNDQTRDNELYENLSGADIDTFKRTRYRFAFSSLFISIMVVVWSLPFVIVRDAVIIDSVISFDYYLKLMPLFTLITLVVFLIANKIGLFIYLGQIQKLELTKSVILLDVFQILCPALIIAIAYFMMFLKVHIVGIAAIPLFILLVLAFIFPVIYFPIKYKEHRKMIVAAGIRNIGIWAAFIVYTKDISSYEVFDGVNNKIESGISYNYNYVIPASILLVAVIGGYLLLKKYWVYK